MSSHVYDPLSPGSIRLLRLSPSQDEQAPIHCHLFPYPLSSSRTGTHLYEALSYYWGSPEKIHTITVGDGSLQITRNLHTALQSLRDYYIERIIWIDAVCINQDDAEDKGRQVQLMAEIYAKASRVVVWLENTTGDPEIDTEAYNNSAGALREIEYFATRLSNGDTDEEVPTQAIVGLLHRAWFRRIWVLQEVAAARHILIKCRLAEIDGYAFCLGLEKMGKVLTDQETYMRVRSTLYLIREATIRPKRVDSTSARFSLQIWPLMNLVEMYSLREATDRRDKLYALLGMSTDMPTGIVPDYRISWAELFSRLANDVVCFLQGASLPTIIRVHEDYCEIIAIAANVTLNEERDQIATLSRDSLSQEAEDLVEFLLVWNWDTSSGGFGGKLNFESFMLQNGLDYAAPCKPDRLLNVGFLFRALGSEKEAILPLSSIVKLYEDSSQRDHPTSLAATDALLEIYKADNSLARRGRTEGLEMMANVLHRSEGFVVMNENLITRIASNPYAEVMRFVLHTYAEQITITENVLVAAAANEKGGKNIMEVLLDSRGDEVTISENILVAAAANWQYGKAIIKLCLERKKDQTVITESVVEAATSPETTFFLLGLENCSFPINGGTCHLSAENWATYSRKPDLDPKDTLRLVATFLKRQTQKIVITARLVHSVLYVDPGSRVRDIFFGRKRIAQKNAARARDLYRGVLAMMLGWEGGRVVVTQEAIEAMAKIRPDKEESLRKLGNELLRELT
ncbi:hypothetical protein G7054_g12191 [Neopestalotiopsis clavispora]|nr:hypothetical protein G7054_g12191 [Neopestalotiopsis clavispora]